MKFIFQRLFVEMEQMASRPTSQVLVEIERREKVNEEPASTPVPKKKVCKFKQLS